VYLSLNGPFVQSAVGRRGVGPMLAVPFPPAPNPRRLVRSSARGLRGLGDCSPNDTACVMASFEASVQRNAAIETEQNRIKRANCMMDFNRTPDSCTRQYPDVTAQMLWNGQDPATPQSMSGGAMPYAPITPYINQNVYTPETLPAPTPFTPNPNYIPPSPPPPAGSALGVSIENVSRPGQTSSFQVGDDWRVTVRGPANSPVTASSVQNGASNPASSFGSTDSSGVRVLTGRMSADTVGSWLENWYVGGKSAGSLTFKVAATPGGGNTGGGAGSGSDAGSGSGSDSLSDLFTKQVGIPFTSVGAPVWMLAAAGIGALVILPNLLRGGR